MKKILFMVNHRLNRSPGQRFRCEQYLNFLKINGFDYDFSYLISEKDDYYFYKKGYYLRKFIILIKSYMIRFSNLMHLKDYDLIYIYREALMTGSVFFEKKLKSRHAKIILDFDDSIWLMDVSKANDKLKFLKNPAKINTLLKLADIVIVGNQYLANYASIYASNVKIIPTTLYTDNYPELLAQCHIKKPLNKVCIGWIGSTTTIAHLELFVPVLKRIEKKYGDKIYFRVIADVPLVSDLKHVENIKWTADEEVEAINYIDIGIMPLPDTQWTRGKCGFKGLQYMSFGIPAIMSPVGINCDIIKDSQNGFLADGEDEWVEKLSLLIENKDLRISLGEAGRQTVEAHYSFQSQKNYYLTIFKSLTK